MIDESLHPMSQYPVAGNTYFLYLDYLVTITSNDDFVCVCVCVSDKDYILIAACLAQEVMFLFLIHTQYMCLM